MPDTNFENRLCHCGVKGNMIKFLEEVNTQHDETYVPAEHELRCENGVLFVPDGIVSQTVADGQLYCFTAETVSEKKLEDYSTLRTCTKQKPQFPLGDVFGKYERYPLGETDCDGGLRTKGIYKKDTSEYPLITYVTVVYNRIETLPRCMESIFTQDYPNIEYIIVDGASTDGTLDLIKAHEDHIDYYMSQKDNGIYNAMNKAISLASGRVISFINSDDFCAEGAASKVAEICRSKNPDLIMGRRKFINERGKITEEMALPQLRIKNCVMYSLPIHHQSTYANRKMFEKLGYYNEDFKYIADYRWESKCMTVSHRMHFLNDDLSVFSIGGLTGTALSIRRWNEWTRLIQEVFPSLSKKQAEILQYGYRHYFKYSDFTAIMKAMGKKLKDPVLRRVLYECGYYIIYLQLYTLRGYCAKHNITLPITKQTVLACRDESMQVGTLQGIMSQIVMLLNKTTKQEDFCPTEQEMNVMCRLKAIVNASYITAEKMIDMRLAKSREAKASVEAQYKKIQKAVTNAYSMLKLAKEQFVVKGLGE